MATHQKPILKSGNIAVWPAKQLSTGHKPYTVSFEKADKERTYVSVFPNIAGYELRPEEILALSLGKPVRMEDENHSCGPKICTIVNRGIESKITEKDEQSYTNNKMILGIAFHKLGENGHTFGYNCNGVNFYAQSGDPKNDQDIYLTPQDCFKLLNGETIIKDNREAFLRHIENVKAEPKEGSTEEVKSYKTARLEIHKISHENTFHLRNNSELQAVEESISI